MPAQRKCCMCMHVQYPKEVTAGATACEYKACTHSTWALRAILRIVHRHCIHHTAYGIGEMGRARALVLYILFRTRPSAASPVMHLLEIIHSHAWSVWACTGEDLQHCLTWHGEGCSRPFHMRVVFTVGRPLSSKSGGQRQSKKLLAVPPTACTCTGLRSGGD